MELNEEILKRVDSFLKEHRLSFSEKDLHCITYNVQNDIKKYHMIFREAIVQEVEDFYGIQLKKKKQEEKCFQFGDYILQGIPNAFNDKTSFWLSKRYMTVAMYCFSADTERELNNQLKNISSYINMFYVSQELKNMQDQKPTIGVDEWSKIFAGKRFPSYLLKELEYEK